MENKKSMTWVLFALGAALAWGFYGVALQTGQIKLASPMKALLFVGIAYFLIGVLAPVGVLSSAGQMNKFPQSGVVWATIGGALGAIGAVCIIYAFKNGGKAAVVMPLVFGGAPLINVMVSMIVNPPKNTPNPLLWLGYLLAAAGGAMVLYFKPV
jgi:uncharacterized membrane protein